MAVHFSIETKHSSFDDELTVHPWNRLVDELCKMIAVPVMDQLISMSRSQLGNMYRKIADNKDYHQFFNTLEDRLKDGVVDFIYNLFEVINLHDDDGNYNFAELIDCYKAEKDKYERQNRLLKNRDFVGRVALLSKIIDYLENEDRYKGVILCGLSGMGKTAIGNEVCHRLKSQKPSWRIVRISEMEKKDIRDLYRDLLCTLDKTFSSNPRLEMEDQLVALQLQLKTEFPKIMTSNRQTLIYIDNVDGYCVDRDQLRKFEAFIHDMVQCIHSTEKDVKIRLLVTVNRSLVNNAEPETECYVGHMVQFEVLPLDDTDAAALLRRISRLSEKDLTDEMCSKINTSVGGNSMALKHIAGNLSLTPADRLRNSIDQLTAQLFDPNSAKFMRVHLQESIDMMGSAASDLKIGILQVLLNFSLFKSAWFTFQDGIEVAIKLDKDTWGAKFDKKHTQETAMILSLLILKTYHLIEIDKTLLLKADTENKDDPMKKSKSDYSKYDDYSYCIHPLVYQYIHEKNIRAEVKDSSVLGELEEAQVRFMKYFCSKIDRIGQEYSMKAHTVNGQALLEQNKAHIRHFYEYFLNGKVSLLDIVDPKGKRRPSSIYKANKSIWKIMDFVQSAEARCKFAQKLSSEAENNRTLHQYVYWKCKEVEFLLCVGKAECAKYLFTSDLTNRLGITSADPKDKNQKLFAASSEWQLNEEQREPTYAVYYETYARILQEEKKDDGQILKYLLFAEDLYRQSGKTYSDDRARVTNCIGHYYFIVGNLEKSEEYHRRAFNVVQGEKEKSRSTDTEVLTCKHLNSSEYLANIAACDHQRAVQTDDKHKKETLLHRALKLYNVCINYDKDIGKDVLSSHAMTLMNRAEVYYRLDKQTPATEDAVKSLTIFKRFYSMPNPQKTLSYAQNAYFCYKFRKSCANPEERKQGMVQSVRLYDEALGEIMHGGLPLDHKEFKDIKEFHMKAMNAAGMSEKEIEQRKNRYTNFVLGKYNKKIHTIKRSLPGRSREAMLQELQARGAVGVVVPSSDNSDSEHDEDESGPSTPESSSASSIDKSSGNEMMSDVDKDDFDLIVEQELHRQRRDSGAGTDEEDVEHDVGSDVSTTNPAIVTTDITAVSTDTKTATENRIPGSVDNVSAVQDVEATETLTSSVSSEGDVGGRLKRSLQRQDSVDLGDPLNPNPAPSTSQSEMDLMLPVDSYGHDIVERRPSKRRKSSVDTGLGAELRLSTSTNRSSLSSIGSQDSVTSQLGKRLTLTSEPSIHEEESYPAATLEDSGKSVPTAEHEPSGSF